MLSGRCKPRPKLRLFESYSAVEFEFALFEGDDENRTVSQCTSKNLKTAIACPM